MKTRQEEKDALKDRMRLIKPILQDILHWKVKFTKEYPEYNTKDGSDRLVAMVNLRGINEKTLIQLEAFAEKHGSKHKD